MARLKTPSPSHPRTTRSQETSFTCRLAKVRGTGRRSCTLKVCQVVVAHGNELCLSAFIPLYMIVSPPPTPHPFPLTFTRNICLILPRVLLSILLSDRLWPRLTEVGGRQGVSTGSSAGCRLLTEPLLFGLLSHGAFPEFDDSILFF